MVLQTIIQGFMELPHFWIIFILSFIATIITTVIYKYATDQKRIKEIKLKLKELRKKTKDHQKDTKKVMELQKEMMSLNMEMMKQSFKSMLYTFIPLIILFTWMSANIAYAPINPGQEFTVTTQISNSYIHDLKDINLTIIPSGEVTRNEAHVPRKENKREIQWKITAEEEGTHTIIIESPTFKETKEVLITNTKKYVNPIKDIKNSQLLKITVGNEPVKPLKPIGLGLNWLWTYILLSVVLSTGIRKLLKVA
ncbi:DUF106 domain-containing protein [Candidatus Woesearchaeota archaeon]|nr:DUF106 domain-containing protein [Candidatus Woesearchaeota archaeon]